ncbi:MAG: class I SAM-dependent methyltransferase [Candidatus Eisenbacteria bacterium]|nr:class I SAM-dependent methyltransferase [Candidatus Eisenbacteria bacterium]
MSYRPREFWDRRLAEHFDLRGTGETGLSLAYNRACYALRREVLERALREAGLDPAGRQVLDVGCGTGFFTAHYLARGAQVTGLDIAPTSVERLRARFPAARFVLADVSEADIEGRFDIVNAFDVIYHITDDARWEAALRRLGAAVAAGGLLLVTDTFVDLGTLASHNRMRPLERYRAVLAPLGFTLGEPRPTAVLLNRELGPLRFLNRAPWLLLALDRALLALGAGHGPTISKLLVARRAG